MSRRSSPVSDNSKTNTYRRCTCFDKSKDVSKNTPSTSKSATSPAHSKCTQRPVLKKHHIVKPKKTSQSEMLYTDANKKVSVDWITTANEIGDNKDSFKTKSMHSLHKVSSNSKTKVSTNYKSVEEIEGRVLNKTPIEKILKPKGTQNSRVVNVPTRMKTKPRCRSCVKIETNTKFPNDTPIKARNARNTRSSMINNNRSDTNTQRKTKSFEKMDNKILPKAVSTNRIIKNDLQPKAKRKSKFTKSSKIEVAPKTKPAFACDNKAKTKTSITKAIASYDEIQSPKTIHKACQTGIVSLVSKSNNAMLNENIFQKTTDTESHDKKKKPSSYKKRVKRIESSAIEEHDDKVHKPAVKQFYKNEKFKLNQDLSNDDFQKTETFLEPIVETSEKATETSIVNDKYFCKTPDSESGTSVSVDPFDDDAVRKLKDFRKENYFECHSAKSRIGTKAYATDLEDHKCTYRFYLNDRLFPVPLYKDHTDNIRCSECYLPLKFDVNNQENDSDIANGAIQAKVQIGHAEKTQDILVMLPVKEPLIIKERRKMPRKSDYDTLYFGIIKLTPSGHSAFKENLPVDSLALRYQKGYREIKDCEKCMFEKVNQGDVIVI